MSKKYHAIYKPLRKFSKILVLSCSIVISMSSVLTVSNVTLKFHLDGDQHVEGSCKTFSET